MDYNKAALEMHETHKGKVGIVSKVEVATRDDLSTAYTPGVAEPCRKIKENPEDVYKYTFKGNMVAVISNGTAVLTLKNLPASVLTGSDSNQALAVTCSIKMDTILLGDISTSAKMSIWVER